MTRAEVKLSKSGPARAAAGRFSGVQHAFDTAAEDTLKKFALLESHKNGSDFLARLFSRSNFGYEKNRRDVRAHRSETNVDKPLEGPRNESMDVDNTYTRFAGGGV